MLPSTKHGKVLVATNRGSRQYLSISGSISLLQLTGTNPIAAAAGKHTIIPAWRNPEDLDTNSDQNQA